MDFTSSLVLVYPELILGGGALALLVLGAVLGDKSSGLIGALSSAVLGVAAVAAAFSQHGQAFAGSFVMDPLAAYAKVAIFLGSIFAIILGSPWFKRAGYNRFEYPILVLLAVLGMSAMVSAKDLIALYIGIELQSLALYVMCAFQRDDERSSEAGLKYFVLGALSSGLLLYGASLIYGFAGSVQFDAIATAVGGDGGTGVVFGLVFLICGLAFKVSAAPFHMWTPDVYEGAPTPVVAFVAGAAKVAAMVLFARALLESFPGVADQWRQVVVVIAVISYAVGAFGGIAQRDLKRLLAYSSIANIGYALLAIAAGTAMGLQAMLVFMVLYMIDVTAFFACLQALNRNGRSMARIEDLAGLSRVKPGLALAITVLSLSLLGLPPLSGFWAKYYVFKAAIDGGLWPVAVAGLVASVVSAFYYLRVIKVMWFDPAPGEVDGPPAEAKWVAYAGALFSFPLVLVALTWLDPAARVAAAGLGLR
jgi:NADH-quinone oxidoreductase subunit N